MTMFQQLQPAFLAQYSVAWVCVLLLAEWQQQSRVVGTKADACSWASAQWRLWLVWYMRSAVKGLAGAVAEVEQQGSLAHMHDLHTATASARALSVLPPWCCVLQRNPMMQPNVNMNAQPGLGIIPTLFGLQQGTGTGRGGAGCLPPAAGLCKGLCLGCACMLHCLLARWVALA